MVHLYAWQLCVTSMSLSAATGSGALMGGGGAASMGGGLLPAYQQPAFRGSRGGSGFDVDLNDRIHYSQR